MKYWELQYPGLRELLKAYQRVRNGLTAIEGETYFEVEAHMGTTDGVKYYVLLVEVNILSEEQERLVERLISDKVKEP